MDSLITFRCGDVLSVEFVEAHSIEPYESFCALEGRFLNAQLLGYKGPRSSFTDYIFYYIKNTNRFRPHRRVFTCTFKKENGAQC